MKLLPDAQRAAWAFAVCNTQWRYGQDGAPTGLHYGDCISALRLRARGHDVARDEIPDLFADVQTMEAAFLAAVHERMTADRAARDTPMATGKGGARRGRA